MTLSIDDKTRKILTPERSKYTPFRFTSNSSAFYQCQNKKMFAHHTVALKIDIFPLATITLLSMTPIDLVILQFGTFVMLFYSIYNLTNSVIAPSL